MAAARSKSEIVDSAIKEARKAPYDDSTYDLAFTTLQSALGAVDEKESKGYFNDAPGTPSPLAGLITDALSKTTSAAAIKKTFAPLKGLDPKKLNDFVDQMVTKIPGGQAFEILRGRANEIKKAYKETAVSSASDAAIDAFFTDLANKDDDPSNNDVKKIIEGISDLAISAQAPYDNSDGKALSTRIEKLLSNPTTYATEDAIARELQAILNGQKEATPRAASGGRDLTFDEMRSTKGNFQSMARVILGMNEKEALAQYKKNLPIHIDNYLKAIDDNITAATNVKAELDKTIKSKSLPQETVDELEKSVARIEATITTLERLKKITARSIKTTVNDLKSYAEVTSPTAALNKAMDEIKKYAEHAAIIATAAKQNAEALKAPKPDKKWKKSNTSNKLEEDFLADLYKAYEQLYALRIAAAGDANAHAKLKDGKGKEAVDAMEEATQKAFKFLEDRVPPGADIKDNPFATQIQNMKTRFNLLSGEMETLGKKDFKDLDMIRFFSPTPPTIGTLEQYKRWTQEFGTTILAGSNSASGLLAQATAEKKNIHIPRAEQMIAKKPELGDNYVKLYPGSSDHFDHSSSVFCEKKEGTNYDFEVHDLPKSISDRGLLAAFLSTVKARPGSNLVIADTNGSLDSKDKHSRIEQAVFNNLPTVVDDDSLKTFLKKHLQFTGVTDDSIISGYNKYRKDQRVQAVEFEGETTDKKWFMLGSREKPMIKVTIPCDAMLEEARIYLNQMSASGEKSMVFKDCKNEQLALALQLIAGLSEMNMKVVFPTGTIKPNDAQIKAVSAKFIATKSGDKTYIAGLASETVPAAIIATANEIAKKVAEFDGSTYKAEIDKEMDIRPLPRPATKLGM